MMISFRDISSVSSRVHARASWLAIAAVLSVTAGCSSTPKQTTPADAYQSTSYRPFSNKNLWDRVRAGFAIPDLDTDLVRKKEAFYSKRPEYMTRMIGRSEKYLHYIVKEIERRGMPTELALLPFVESAYRPGAVSSAKAAGMWQFIPSTGRHYDLKQNVFRDERRDVIASTNAALDYLQNLYNMFGDWQLALASYNWGEGNVQRAIKRNQAAGKGTRYQDLRMPRETREYIPKLQAIENIVRNPGVFDTVIPHVQDRPYFAKVPIDRDIDVDVAARMAGIGLRDFRDLNPASNKSLIIASVTPHILLPIDSVDAFKSNLRSVGNRPLASWTAWVPKTNVTVEQAAALAGTDVATLRRINRLPRRGSIRAGSVLLVPRKGRRRADISRVVANTSHGVRASWASPRGKRVATKRVVLQRTRVKIRRGDTLSRIAARYGLPPRTVAKWNRMRVNQRLIAGRTVVLHIPKSQLRKRAAGRPTRVKIRRGDTLARIAKRHGVSTKQLARWNGMRTNQRLIAGRTLMLRGGRATTQRTAGRSSRVKIRRGDTLARIAKRHGVSTKQLARWNGIKTNSRLVAGKTLVLRGGKAESSRSAASRSGRVKIRRGDTLSRIAARHGVSAKQLARWNGIKTNSRLVAGKTLVLRGGKAVPSKKRQAATRDKRVKIRRGDTLSRIARRHGVSAKQLARWNGMKTSSKLVAGKTLLVRKSK